MSSTNDGEDPSTPATSTSKEEMNTTTPGVVSSNNYNEGNEKANEASHEKMEIDEVKTVTPNDSSVGKTPSVITTSMTEKEEGEVTPNDMVNTEASDPAKTGKSNAAPTDATEGKISGQDYDGGLIADHNKNDDTNSHQIPLDASEITVKAEKTPKDTTVKESESKATSAVAPTSSSSVPATTTKTTKSSNAMSSTSSSTSEKTPPSLGTKNPAAVATSTSSSGTTTAARKKKIEKVKKQSKKRKAGENGGGTSSRRGSNDSQLGATGDESTGGAKKPGPRKGKKKKVSMVRGEFRVLFLIHVNTYTYFIFIPCCHFFLHI